ncbi:hypothetical protein ACFLSE_09475, partial [Bacteroidota bacterium]
VIIDKSIILFLILIVASCNFNQSEPKIVSIGDENIFLELADTIITDVVILNPNNDEWTEYCLRNLDRKILVDEIFKSVYSGDLIPFEFFYNKPLSISDIKDLEENPEFSREKIAKAQFEEAWYYDPVSQQMTKKVLSIMLAYEIYDLQGEVKGYKPAFKVYLK